MTNQEKRLLDMFKRVRDFDAAHDNLFPAGSLGRDLFNVILGIINDLEGLGAAEFGGHGTARQGTAGKSAARAAILEDLRILRRTARAMALVIPGLEEKFRIPRNPDDHDLLITARGALAAAEPLKAEFLRREVQESVFEELEANVAAFETALTGQNTGQDESKTAGASIDAAIDRGMDALRQLDPIVRNKLHHNTALLAAWLSAKRIERAPRRNNSNTPPAPQTPNS
jgi:hypothetical protein